MVCPRVCITFVLLCPTFLSYFLLNPAEKLIGSELVSMYQYFLPVVATIASVIMKVATIRWFPIVAMLLIIAGMVMTELAKRRQRLRSGSCKS